MLIISLINGGSSGVDSVSDSPDELIDSDSIQHIYQKHVQELRLFLFGLLKNQELSEDALQSTFVKAIEAGQTVKPQSMKSWLFRVAYNEAMMMHRKRKLESRSHLQLSWITASDTETAEQGMIKAETLDVVKQELKSLPAEQFEIVYLKIYQRKTFQSIADQLSLPLGTVLTRMRLALTKLTRKLKPEDFHA